jgi:protein-disulfide isomerase
MNKKVGLAAILAVSTVLLAAGATRFLPAPQAAARPPAAKDRAPAAVAPAGAAARADGATAPANTLVEAPDAVYRVPLDDSPVRGPRGALVTVVEVMDFECPYCKRVAPTLAQLRDAYGGEIRFVFKHFPLSMHNNAMLAAMLAEEARAQGGEEKFWATHDALLAEEKLDRPALERIARSLRLDEARVKAALDGHAHLERARRDQSLAASLAVRGTPTFFVNGAKVQGAKTLEAFKAVVDAQLVKAKGLVEQGVRPEDVYARIVEKGATAPVMIPAPPQPEVARPVPPSPPPGLAAKVTVRADDPARGPSTAPVTVVLFSDFQCPFCSKVEPVLKQIEATYPRDVRITWKHLPLPFHPNALPAAKAAEAARAQGQFWGMHDRLFAGQQALSDQVYLQHAQELKLDVERFRKALSSEATARRIAEDQALAAATGATGTPTLFVNCRKLVGAQPFEAFKTIIDEEIAKARGAKVDGGTYDRACAANVAAAPPVAAAPTPREVKVVLRPDDPAIGKKDAKVTVVEFSDFQCPFCSRAVPAVKELEKKLGRDVRVVWKHLPLPFHPNAMPAAIAAEAARQQGKFWQMHDRLFAGQQSLSDAFYATAARDLGLDVAKFERARKDPSTRARVEEDARVAAAAGVNGTPTFIVNGEQVVGSAALDEAVRRHLDRRVAKN